MTRIVNSTTWDEDWKDITTIVVVAQFVKEDEDTMEEYEDTEVIYVKAKSVSEFKEDCKSWEEFQRNDAFETYVNDYISDLTGWLPDSWEIVELLKA